MVDTELTRIKEDLKFITDIPEVRAVLIFGSYVHGDATPRSDVDICVVAPDLRTSKERSVLLGKIWRGLRSNRYDVRLFEELPLHIQIEIIENNIIVYCDDVPELFEYFYFYRKLWKDQAHRQAIDFI